MKLSTQNCSIPDSSLRGCFITQTKLGTRLMLSFPVIFNQAVEKQNVRFFKTFENACFCQVLVKDPAGAGSGLGLLGRCWQNASLAMLNTKLEIFQQLG